MNQITLSFNTLGANEQLVSALKKLDITQPTPIQAQAIPLLLEGKDILASAQTGTGKTIAYTLPILQKLLANPNETALILVPTRELAIQVKDSILKILGFKSPIFTAVLIGGEAMTRQFMQLKRHPRIIVATPGRLNDHLNRKSVNLSSVKYLVLDETDRMLDMGFSVQLDAIAEYLPTERQTMMFSATMPSNMMKLAAKYLKEPQRISIGQQNQAVSKIKQDVVRTSQTEKWSTLLKELEQREGSVIVFVRTKMGAEKLADQLRGQQHSADALHGDLKQNHRSRVIQAFRNQKHRIMVATDVAARGLDVPHVQHVINYDLPQCPEDYIHRIGRTGRAGSEGNALCMVAPSENHLWKAIQRLMDPEASKDILFSRPSKSNDRRQGQPRSDRPRRKFGGNGGADRSEGNRNGGFNRFEGSRSGGTDRSEGNRNGGFNRFEGSRSGAARSEGNRTGGAGRFEGNRSGGADRSEGNRFEKPSFEKKRFNRDKPHGDSKKRAVNARGSEKPSGPNKLTKGIKQFFSNALGKKK